MAPRKGLSFEEKRERLQQLFTETADFFTLKELEKIASKRKGIVSQSVKEVLQSLVDDNLVNTDKCGVQTVFWCLPSEVSQKKKTKLAKLREDLERKQAEEQKLQQQLDQAQTGREDSDERSSLIAEITKKEAKLEEIELELARFAEFDPDEMKKLEQNIDRAREAANRWVDNIFNCQSWAAKTFSMDKKDFEAQFGIPTELDYLES